MDGDMSKVKVCKESFRFRSRKLEFEGTAYFYFLEISNMFEANKAELLCVR